MSYSITAIEGIDADDAKALKSVGSRTTEKLLEAAKSPKGRKFLAAKAELDEKRLLRWANIADKLRIKGMGREYAGLLCAVGVETVKELRYRNPARLAEARDALGRARPEATPENHVSIDPSCGQCGRLTPLPRPAQSDGHDAGAPSCRFRPRREKIAGSARPPARAWPADRDGRAQRHPGLLFRRRPFSRSGSRH